VIVVAITIVVTVVTIVVVVVVVVVETEGYMLATLDDVDVRITRNCK
jgi:hypothetical protein